MEITTDVYLKGNIWEDTLERLKGSIFEQQWQIYALCVSIGIMYDKQLDFESDADPKYIPRNVLTHSENVALLDFMFQTAILTTKNVDLNEDKRLELAFGEEKDNPYNRLGFLTQFANYGVTVISKYISDTDNEIETMESLMTFLNETYESGVDDPIDEIIEEN